MDVPPKQPPHTQFRRHQYGVYLLTYEDPSVPFMSRVRSLLDWFHGIHETVPYLRRFMVDTLKLAPMAFVVYLVTTVWRVGFSAANLYFLCVLYEMLGGSLADRRLSPEMYQSLAVWWISYNMISIVAERLYDESFEAIMKRFRAHYSPKLIRASLKIDALSIQRLHSFVRSGRFESNFPGGEFFEGLELVTARTFDFTFHLLVLLYAISGKPSPEREVLFGLCIAQALIWWLVPSNGIGSSAYVYWPTSRNFQRMKTLYNLALSIPYRADLILDDVASSIETGFTDCMEKMRNIEVLEPVPWRVGLERNWYWDVLKELVLHCPVALYVIMFSVNLSPSSISSIALLRQISQSMLRSITRYTHPDETMLNVCQSARRLYNSIEYHGTMAQGTEHFPRLMEGSGGAGMKISFRHVYLRYPGRDHDALYNVSFDILPGELVLVVGTNGSGKSSMLKLLARLFDPTAGCILVDDLPLTCYDMHQLRSAMAFQSQTPAVYPFTIKENIALGLPLTYNVEQGYIEAAARMGGCSEWISKLADGYDTEPEPLWDLDCRWMSNRHGFPSVALLKELDRHRGHLVSISGGEKQRLASARTFLRINNNTTRLVVVDEATSSLDPVAELNILTEFRKIHAGKTTLFVTHRFHHLAREADRILCMKDGTIVENGTHAELIRAGGEYATLYHAQVKQTI